MNNITHEYLDKHRLIGTINAGDRLDTTNGLSIYQSTWLNALYRNWYGDTRYVAVQQLQELYCSIRQSVEYIITDIREPRRSNKREESIRIAVSLAEKLKKSISGVENLSKTYNKHREVCSRLEGIIEDFAIDTYIQLLAVIPIDRHTDQLKEPVRYKDKILYECKDELTTINTASPIYSSNHSSRVNTPIKSPIVLSVPDPPEFSLDNFPVIDQSGDAPEPHPIQREDKASPLFPSEIQNILSADGNKSFEVSDDEDN